MKPIRMIPPFKVNFIVKSLDNIKNYGIEMHNIPEAWKEIKGEEVKVCVIDTGKPVHKDLNCQIDESANFTDSPIEDLIVGHGTHTAGIVGAIDTDEGVIGIAPRVRLYIAKSLDDSGSGSDDSMSEGIEWAISKQVDIISMSLGAPAEVEFMFPKTKESIRKAYKAGITIICAAGNESANKVGFPASMPETISVAAVDNKEQHASFSNDGRIDFAAAGVNIISTYINNSYASLSGTSMATPQISGIAALIIAKHRSGLELPDHDTPINGPEDVREHLKKICQDLGSQGYDEKTGYGLPVWGHIYDIPIPPIQEKKTFWQKIIDFFKNIF